MAALGAAGVPTLVAGLSRAAGSALHRFARVASGTDRCVWSVPGRHHIEVRGVERDGADALAARVEQLLEQLPGVAWARVNAPTARVIVAVQPPEPRIADLTAAVAAAERMDGLEPDGDLEPPHPPEEGPRTRKALSTLAADGVGLGLSVLTRILPFAPLPGEVAGLANLIDYHPRLHALAAKWLHGARRADSVLPLIEALSQGLAGGWTGIAVDGTQRILQWREARAQQAAWAAAEEQLTGTPERAAAARVAQIRPVPLPDGPLERYANRILAAGGAAGAIAFPLAGFKRSAALALSALPKAAFGGREAYAARVGRILAQRGVIAMDRGVLRELERLDTLVLDEDAVGSDRAMLTDLAPLTNVDPEQVATAAFALFDPYQPDARREGDGWVLAPLDQLPERAAQPEPGSGEGEHAPSGPSAAQPEPGPGGGEHGPSWPSGANTEHARRLGADGGTALGLARGGELVAVVRAEPEPTPDLDVVAAAARRAGMRLIVAGGDGRRHDFADRLMPGGAQLVDSVRTLQGEGAGVMLVSGNRRALGASDCGLGVRGKDGEPPWGAHLLLETDLTAAALVVDAAGMARAVARHSVTLSRAGTGLGALAAFTSPPRRLPTRTLNAVNTTAGVAMAAGLWSAQKLDSEVLTPPGASVPWHLMPIQNVLERLHTGPDGLSAEEAHRRTQSHASEGGGSMGLGRAFVEELANPLAPVLATGAGLSAVVGSPVDAGLVGGVLGLTALVGAVQRVATDRSLAALLSRSMVSARVRRDGTEQVVAAGDLVPGDVVALHPGDVIPADCRVIEADGLEADESSLTGESLPVGKAAAPVIAAAVADRTSMLYEGTTVAAGQGSAVVVATGVDTEVGRGMALARQAPPATGVEARLGRLTRTAVPLAATSAAAVASAGLLRGVPLGQTAAEAANLAVASVPEGLPFLVSAAQLAAARRLAGQGALVRNPRTIEALGRVDVLCFDKTGTLTEGRLGLAGVGSGDRYADLHSIEEPLRRVLAAALRATPADPTSGTSLQTDRAVLEGAESAQVRVDIGAPGWEHTCTLPFEPSRGYHATVGTSQEGHLLSVKGAPETIVPRCSAQRLDDEQRPLGDAERRELLSVLERHAGAGHRVLAVAERAHPTPTVCDDDVDELTFVGFVALADSVRESASPAVRRIREAGVHTIMITGDHPATAEAIAATISTDGSAQRVVTASELDEVDDDGLARLLAETDVVARCTPAHKVRIIQSLQRGGRTVAMTGDGANDAPAIRLADVGIALGQRGTPAASAAADLVVTDDRLETIIAALIEGRAMWSSVRHALSILIGGNLGEITFSVLTAAATGRSALTARQLLLVNLLTDLAPAMAIAVRPPKATGGDELLREGPDASLDSILTRDIAVRAASTALGATTGWTLGRVTGPRRAGTIALAALVGTQLGQTMLAGGTNPATVAATAASAGVLVAIIQTPGVSQFFGCTPLGPVGWTIAAGAATGATLGNAALSRLLPGGLPLGRHHDKSQDEKSQSEQPPDDAQLPAHERPGDERPGDERPYSNQ
ncbi:cation-translocating P-type ATPase [Rugosimonospora africana]|nr:cation-translocating P-type ATPase [Rugosimonospora africana]